MKTTICSIGECMIEMTNVEKELYNYSVAGDTLNFTSYLDQSIFNKFYLTAIGTSDINKGVISFFKKKKINTDLVKKISSKEIGLYLIKNTKRGEKKFYYWRDDSAANFFFNHIKRLNSSKTLLCRANMCSMLCLADDKRAFTLD